MTKFEVIFLDDRKSEEEVICELFIKENIDGAIYIQF